MSHVVKVKTIEVRDREALEVAVQRAGATLVNEGRVCTHKLYGGQSEHGIGVRLKDWNYPVVFNLDTGKVSYDNFNGSWGNQDHLDGLIHDYTLEAAKLAAMREDPTVFITETQEENGDTRLVMEYA